MLRCYPPRFGAKLVDLFDLMSKEKLGMPELPSEIPSCDQVFAAMDFTDLWGEAKMTEVCHYLRGGMHLKIPKEFLHLLPTKL